VPGVLRTVSPGVRQPDARPRGTHIVGRRDVYEDRRILMRVRFIVYIACARPTTDSVIIGRRAPIC